MAQRTSGRTTPSAGRALKLLAAFAAVSVGAGVVAAGLAVPAVAVAAKSTTSTVGAFNSLPAELQEQPLSQQSKILYADGSVMATFYYENRTEVPLDQVAPVMQTAIVAIEDSRFWQHGGVDLRGMGRAFVNNAANSDNGVQGASTLTQQWIKNVQVEKAVSALPSNATTAQRKAAFDGATESKGIAGYTRKLREIKLAIAADKKLSKQQILDNYLNITSFGDGQYGVEAASKHYFNRSAKDLDLPDAALLAGIVQNPIILDPVTYPDRAFARRNIVLDRMLQLKVISQADHDAARAVPLAQQLQVQPIQNGCTSAGDSGFFCDYVVKQFRDDDVFGGTKDSRLQLLYRGGLSITTTLDRAKEQAAVEEINNGVPAATSSTPGTESPVGASIVSVEPGTGKIIAMAQDRKYDTSENAPAGSTSLNFNTDFSTGGSRGFQPGSTFKPFVLANWLSTGHTLNQLVDGRKRNYPASSWKMGGCGRNTSPWFPGNAGDGEEDSQMSVLEATYKSINTGYAAIENQLQLCDIRATAESLGVHKAVAGDNNPEQTVSTRLGVYPSMVLGTDEVSPLTIASAYAAFAAQGKYCAPMSITSITDADGHALSVPGPKCNQAISPEVANGVTYALTQTITRGTANGNDLAGGRVAAGKTGTTNKSVSAWFTGYTPQLATSVWLGHTKSSFSLNRSTIAGQRKGIIYGATISAPIWKNYMNRALADTPKVGFTPPPGSILGSVQMPKSTATATPTRRPSTRPSSAPAPVPAPANTPPAAPAPTAPSTQAAGTPPKRTDVETLDHTVTSSTGSGKGSSSPSPTTKKPGGGSSGGGKGSTPGSTKSGGGNG